MPKKFKNKQEESEYNSVHMWVHRHYGKAAKCEICGATNPDKRYEWANVSGEYRRERSDFRELCQSCHKKHDHGNKCKRGHEYTAANTYIRGDGNRQCRACMNIAKKKYYTKKRKYAMD